jgi:ABC-type phosphate/phosphonate transport system permease subunit
MSLLKPFTTRNVGKLDRIVRSFPAIIVAYLYFTGFISGWIAIVLGILALMLVLTSITGSCSIYYFLKLSTCSKKNSRNPK